jgi:CO/xanthine dehydrogenase Mo-binding subunit
MAGGGFGRRAIPTSDYVVEACGVAKAARTAGINAPVRTLWSREDDIKGGYYRPMHVHRAEIGFDAKGNILAWDHVIVGQSITKGSPFEAFMVKNGVDSTAGRGHERALQHPHAPLGAPPAGQRARAVVAQRGQHPHRLRHGNPARRSGPPPPSKTPWPTACA